MLEKILDCLNATRCRATYKAVGDVLGVYHRNVRLELPSSANARSASWTRTLLVESLPPHPQNRATHAERQASPVSNRLEELPDLPRREQRRRALRDGAQRPGRKRPSVAAPPLA